ARNRILQREKFPNRRKIPQRASQNRQSRQRKTRLFVLSRRRGHEAKEFARSRGRVRQVSADGERPSWKGKGVARARRSQDQRAQTRRGSEDRRTNHGAATRGSRKCGGAFAGRRSPAGARKFR